MKKWLTLCTALMLFGSMSVNAATATTVYYAVPSATVGTYTVKLNVNRQGDGNNWQQYTMTLSDKTYNSDPIYTCDFTDLYDGLGALQFQLYDGSTWKSQVQPISSWTSASNYNGKMWVHGSNSWREYTYDGGDPIPSYTFPAGTTIYYDFTAYGGGVNVCINGSEPYHENTSAIFSVELNAAWEVTATTNLFKSAPNGWSYKTCSTLPEEGQNMLVGDADGIVCHWDTYTGGMPDPTPATIQLHSNITNPSWESSANFALAGNEETASLTLTGVTKGDYEFGVKIDGTWTSNGSGFTRANPSHEVVAGSGNCTFSADRNGDYTFTWTYATNTLSVTYPAVPAQSVELTGLSAQILRGTEVAFAATSSGIDEPGYRFYVKEKNGSYGSAVASYPFDVVGEYVVKVEALEYNTGDPVASDESGIIVVYDEHTFTSGDVLYVDFSAVSGDAKGVNYPAAGEKGLAYDAAGAGTIKTVTFSADVTWTTNDVFVKTEKAGWAELKFTVPGSGENCVVVAADGASYTWTTLVPPPPTIKLHGDFTGSWANTDAFVLAGNNETASLTLNIQTKGEKEFGVRIGSDDNWTSNGASFSRSDASKVVTSGTGNCKLDVDAKGDYTFTWTFASNTLSVTYPALPAQSVAFDGLAAQILKGTEVTFAATSSGIDNPVYSYFVKQAGGEYGSAVAAYTFNAEGNFVVKVSAEGDNTAAPVVAEENVSVYDAHTFTSGTTIFVDFSAMTEGTKGVNYPSTDAAYAGSYDAAGAGTVKTVTFSTNVTWTTNDVFIKTEKAGWDPGLKFTVPGDGKNCAVVAADGASYTWGTHTAPVVTVEAMGEWDGWTDALAFVTDGSGLTATATLAGLPAGNYAFKLIVGGGENWRSNENAFHRFWTSASGITENLDNMELQADADGDYVFTWTFATNAIEITFPSTPKTGTNEVKFFPPRTEEHPWNEVYVYAWRRTGDGDVRLSENEWPGDPATKDGEWYKITVEKGACVVFNDNNNGMQSFDIENVQKDACYVANAIDNSEHELDPSKPVKAKFYESCTVNFFITGDEGIMGSGNAWKENLAERQLNGSNSIELHLNAGIYEFKLTNGSWAWSLGGKEHLNTACSNGAATTGNGNVKFKLEDEQDVTISYNPTTQKICLDATTALPYEDVRTGLTADNYYTVCFNREMRQIRGASLWSFIGRDADFAYIVQESAPFEAGKPYILFAESDKLEAVLDGTTITAGANGALHGTFVEMDQVALDDAGDNIYLVIGNKLRQVDGQSGNTLPAYRAYVDVDEIAPIPSTDPNPAPGRQVRRMPMQKDVATGFESIEASDKPMKVMIDGTLYILRGENMYNVNGQIVK